ncbi:MAG: protein-glutamate O-methyltransferase CheR [Cellvibrio sp.]|nr:protein-glutamate O-methyltransferase CheR [Cellvibrio sp.]
MDQNDFNQFRQFLEDACGISLGENKQYLVSNRIRKILEDNKIDNLGELVRQLKQGVSRRLRDQVIDSMTTNETFWFRDTYPYEHLKNVHFPQLLTANNKSMGSVRIWSAACSSGQEPYSISIMVEEFKRQQMGVLPKQVQIVATDLSTSIMEQAKSGEYDKLSVLRGLSQERLDRYFDKSLNDNWRVKPFIKEKVEFRVLNLMDSYSSLGKFDMVFCRNVLIYFNGDLKRQILQKIHGCLKPGGILYVGSSESLSGASDLFEMIKCEPGIYYRAI